MVSEGVTVGSGTAGRAKEDGREPRRSWMGWGVVPMIDQNNIPVFLVGIGIEHSFHPEETEEEKNKEYMAASESAFTQQWQKES
ncbi:hypothetical protein LOK49_LG12G01062 [Camellia lanceoleosa]|uniref:Uncharacterized protein n=1 Tax=Camellia lanceoleosa TaxID=1840588 RepID=A0ACC0FP88_9ERIC|nr:hypothetical protein LOK49_LG12G01062 [Camellia lanceoleosa]